MIFVVVDTVVALALVVDTVVDVHFTITLTTIQGGYFMKVIWFLLRFKMKFLTSVEFDGR